MTAEPTANVTIEPGRFLTFRLDRETYAVPILAVREIVELQEISPVPRASPWVRGVVNLRGRVLPVIDPKVRFGMLEVQASDLTVIVVLQDGDGKPFGLLVDEVLEVQRFDASQLSAAPDGVAGGEQVLVGFAKHRDQLVFLLDPGPLGLQ